MLLNMEALREKYGFNNDQMEDIKQVLIQSIQDIIPGIVNDIAPTITENLKHKLMSDADELEKMSKKRILALNYVQNQIKEWQEHLGRRSNKYWQYMRCVNNHDLYTECLEEEPRFIPRVFRKDKKHSRTTEGKL